MTLSRTNQLSRESSKLTRVAIVSHYTRKLSDTRLQNNNKAVAEAEYTAQGHHMQRPGRRGKILTCFTP